MMKEVSQHSVIITILTCDGNSLYQFIASLSHSLWMWKLPNLKNNILFKNVSLIIIDVNA